MRAVFSFIAVILLCAGGTFSSLVLAQTSRPISGVVAASSGSITVSYTDETGQQIGRTAGIGDPIYLNDEIKTGPDTSLQILLKDQTVFSLGPNGSIVFDEFIYDPSGNVAPSFSATVTKGTFKFISGKIASAKPEAMKVNLPNATASIRGTAVAGRVKEEGDSEIVLLTGAISVVPDTGGPVADIFQSGWGTSISAAGAVAEPFVVPAEMLNDILSTVEVNIVLPQNTIAATSEARTEAAAQTTLAPEDIETIDQLVEVVVSTIASDDDGNININDLAQFILASGLAEQLGISPEDLEDDANSNLNIEAELLQYLAAGGQPLWLTVDRTSGTDFVNPPPSSWASEDQNSFKYEMWSAFQNNYDGLVSNAYQGSISFGKTGLTLGTGTLINSVPDGYNANGYATFTNPNSGSATLDYSVVLDYDAGNITGSMDLRDISSGGVNFTDQTANINVTDFSSGNLEIDPLLLGIDLASATGISSDASDTGRYLFEGSFGSITDGTNIIDGRIGSFALEFYNESNPAYAEIDAAAGLRTFIDQAGSEMTFNSNWTDNGDNTFSGTNVTYDLGDRVVVDSNNLAVDGVFSGDQSTLTYNSVTYNFVNNTEGPNYYADENDVNNQLYVYQGVQIPALKVEQYEAGTASE